MDVHLIPCPVPMLWTLRGRREDLSISLHLVTADGVWKSLLSEENAAWCIIFVTKRLGLFVVFILTCGGVKMVKMSSAKNVVSWCSPSVYSLYLFLLMEGRMTWGLLHFMTLKPPHTMCFACGVHLLSLSSRSVYVSIINGLHSILTAAILLWWGSGELKTWHVCLLREREMCLPPIFYIFVLHPEKKYGEPIHEKEENLKNILLLWKRKKPYYMCSEDNASLFLSLWERRCLRPACSLLCPGGVWREEGEALRPVPSLSLFSFWSIPLLNERLLCMHMSQWRKERYLCPLFKWRRRRKREEKNTYLSPVYLSLLSAAAMEKSWEEGRGSGERRTLSLLRVLLFLLSCMVSPAYFYGLRHFSAWEWGRRAIVSEKMVFLVTWGRVACLLFSVSPEKAWVVRKKTRK